MSEVNVLSGKAGWYERIDNEENKVARTATLTDEVNLDKTGKAYDQIHASAKKEVMQKHTPSVARPLFATGARSSRNEEAS